MIPISPLILGIIFFILGILLISFGADAAIDGIEDISEKFSLSPILLALFVLGVDLEEFITSLIAASNGKGEVAIGNVIGNSIITLTIIIALPGLFYTISYKKIESKFIVLLWGSLLVILFSFIFPIPIWILGIFSLILYTIYTVTAFKSEKLKIKTVIPIQSISQENNNNDAINDNELKQIDGNERVEKEKKTYWIIIKTILGIIALYFGSELLGNGLENILSLTSISEGFMGILIIAAATNAEEYFILFKSIKKKKTEIGISTLIGKLMWNVGITYSISSFIIGNLDTSSLLLFSNILLLVIVIMPIISWVMIKKKESNWKNSILLLICFIIYLLLAFLFQFL